MAKLYPPVIEGAIPAFYANEDGTVTITIPFSMNRAVSKVQVEGFAVKIRVVHIYILWKLPTPTVTLLIIIYLKFMPLLKIALCYLS